MRVKEETQVRPFIGLGTGRMGTNSLQKLVGACRNTIVGHETQEYLTPWYEEMDMQRIDKLICWLEENSKKGFLAGEVTPSLVPKIDYIRARLDIKIICLHRPKEEVIESYMRKCGGKSLVLPNQGWSFWCQYAPTISADSVQESYGAYWELYEEIVGSMEGVYHFNTYDLSDKDKLEQLFDFLEIPVVDRVFLEKTVWNASL